MTMACPFRLWTNTKSPRQDTYLENVAVDVLDLTNEGPEIVRPVDVDQGPLPHLTEHGLGCCIGRSRRVRSVWNDHLVGDEWILARHAGELEKRFEAPIPVERRRYVFSNCFLIESLSSSRHEEVAAVHRRDVLLDRLTTPRRLWTCRCPASLHRGHNR
jgi:hypothetical protein